jgi:hypothetical protein
MKLADCTKEELIWLIQYRCYHTAKDFEFDILIHRDEENQKAASAAFERANSALGEYCNLLKPYDGKPLISIPDSVIHKATEKMKTREVALKQYDKLEKQYKSIQKRIDEILSEKDGEPHA